MFYFSPSAAVALIDFDAPAEPSQPPQPGPRVAMNDDVAARLSQLGKGLDCVSDVLSTGNEISPYCVRVVARLKMKEGRGGAVHCSICPPFCH